MAVYYNEYDAETAAWLRELVRRGLLPDGEVDTRSICEVSPEDLKGFTQCHFFAGIGGWALALRMAGIPESVPMWTGSCPCQPFSTASGKKGKGLNDERHLWPVFNKLISERKPTIIVGEQVETAVKWGWLDAVYRDLEAQDYAVGSAVLSAECVGAPHIRKRLYWGARRLDYSESAIRYEPVQSEILENSLCNRRERWRTTSGYKIPSGIQINGEELVSRTKGFWGNAEWYAGIDGSIRPIESGLEPLAYGVPARVVRLRGYGNAIVPQTAVVFLRALLGN